MIVYFLVIDSKRCSVLFKGVNTSALQCSFYGVS